MMRFLSFFILAAGLVFFAFASQAQETPYSSATISGLGARNIGSATMSGRISAMAATREPSGKITLFEGPAAAGGWKSTVAGHRFGPDSVEKQVKPLAGVE